MGSPDLKEAAEEEEEEEQAALELEEFVSCCVVQFSVREQDEDGEMMRRFITDSNSLSTDNDHPFRALMVSSAGNPARNMMIYRPNGQVMTETDRFVFLHVMENMNPFIVDGNVGPIVHHPTDEFFEHWVNQLPLPPST